MDKFVIDGGRVLKGRVRISGAKNAALPMMAASLLTTERVILKGVPDLRDIQTMSKLLGELGVKVHKEADRLVLQSCDEHKYIAPYELVSTMRASVCVLGPLLGRRRKAKVSMPGGCVIGVRPIDLHIKGMTALGARISYEHGYIVGSSRALRGTQIYLGGPHGSSVTGTENVMMAAVLAKGTTIIENAACEPEVQDLAHMLNRMGARIEGIGTHRLVIKGVTHLRGTEYKIIPDRIEAGTFMVATVITGGDVILESVIPEHLVAVIETLGTMGADITVRKDNVHIKGNKRIRSTDITTLPYPGVPTDMQAQLMALLTLGDGIGIITEKVYPDRFLHVAELNRMGARIRKEGNSAIVQGVPRLHGAPVMASDLRASAALVLAALAAKGQTEITRVYHLDRGYYRLEERLQRLGGMVRRVIDKRFIVMPSEGS